ncbi:Hypothetical predicted protein [Octopus vulgaris]|uniref:Uncharacterized protein n=1 Tax=Octopus vulgaris TaxID=6645 RepID=A0AA36FBQ9_OCTVU|nr:Hypothetical predicted protein [Octopus vulgaris]
MVYQQHWNSELYLVSLSIITQVSRSVSSQLHTTTTTTTATELIKESVCGCMTCYINSSRTPPLISQLVIFEKWQDTLDNVLLDYIVFEGGEPKKKKKKNGTRGSQLDYF